MSVTEIVHQVKTLNHTELEEFVQQLEQIKQEDALELLADESEKDLITERRLEPKRPMSELLREL